MAVFRGNSPFSLKASPIAPPVSFTKPLPAYHANQQPVWRRDWDQFENFFGHNFASFFTSNIKQILSKLPRVVLLKGVGKCGCTILPKIFTFYVVLDVFLKVLKFFFFWRGLSIIGARLFQWFCSIFLNFCVLWYRNPSLMGQQNITRSTETQELLVFFLSFLENTVLDKHENLNWIGLWSNKPCSLSRILPTACSNKNKFLFCNRIFAFQFYCLNEAFESISFSVYLCLYLIQRSATVCLCICRCVCLPPPPLCPIKGCYINCKRSLPISSAH